MGSKEVSGRFRQIAGPVFGLGIFIIALIVLRNQLHHYHYHEIAAEIEAIPFKTLGLALVFTILNYAVLSLYEIEGFRYIKNNLPKSKIVLASFIVFSFSNNVGFYSLSGGAVRFRLYSAWGLSNMDITKLITFSSGIAFWLGLLTICGITFLMNPEPIPVMLHLPHISLRALSILFIGIVAAFLLFTLIRKKPVKVFHWDFEVPSFWLTTLLLGTVCLDWIFFSAVLYTLLPVQSIISFPHFISLFMLAQLAGLISHVPGGLGVFETVFLAILPQEIPKHSAFGAILVYRAIYYLLPLALSSILLVLHEVNSRKAMLRGFSKVASNWGNAIVPPVFTILVFVSGIILLFSGATPGVEDRLHLLKHFFPLPFIELSHFFASVAGVILLILSWGIYRRFDSAYYLTLYTLAAGILFSIIKGFDYEEALILLFACGLLIPCRRYFYRKTSFLQERFTIGWLLAIMAVIGGTIWLGMFSYKHTAYAKELWWQFSLSGNASRFLRASAGSAVVLIIFGLLRLFKAARPRSDSSIVDSIIDVVPIVKQSPNTSSNLALLGDKNFLWHDDRKSFVMYGVQGRSWIAMGDPVGDPDTFRSVVWKFKEMADRHAGRVAFYEVNREYLHIYIDIGLSLMKMGENARVDLPSFTFDGSSKKPFRYIVRHLEQDGWRFEIVNTEHIRELLPQLREISDFWLKQKNTKEKRFSLGCFDEEYISRSPVAVVRKSNSIAAFTNMWLSDTKNEVSIDLMRYGTDAPKGIMDYMFVKLIAWSKEQEYRWFDLGMAPFSGLEDHPLAPVWSKLGAFLYRHGENFYNFQGLRQFKEKFDPVWEPKYLASPGGLSLPIVLRDAAALISSGMKGVIGK
jgi:phosphatidylglycerol lysyltransferase